MCAVLTYVMASKRRGEFGGAVKEEGEEKSDELMLLHCSSYRHTLHFVVFFFFFLAMCYCACTYAFVQAYFVCIGSTDSLSKIKHM